MKSSPIYILLFAFVCTVTAQEDQDCPPIGQELLQNGGFDASRRNIDPWLPTTGSVIPSRPGFRSRQSFGQFNVTYNDAAPQTIITQNIPLCTSGFYEINFAYRNALDIQCAEMSLSQLGGSNLQVCNSNGKWRQYKFYLDGDQGLLTYPSLAQFQVLEPSDRDRSLDFNLDKVSVKRIAAFPAQDLSTPNLISQGTTTDRELSFDIPTVTGKTYVLKYNYNLSVNGTWASSQLSTSLQVGNKTSANHFRYFDWGFKSTPSFFNETVVIPVVARSSSVGLSLKYETFCSSPGFPFPTAPAGPCTFTFEVSKFSFRVAS